MGYLAPRRMTDFHLGMQVFPTPDWYDKRAVEFRYVAYENCSAIVKKIGHETDPAKRNMILVVFEDENAPGATLSSTDYDMLGSDYKRGWWIFWRDLHFSPSYYPDPKNARPQLRHLID